MRPPTRSNRRRLRSANGTVKKATRPVPDRSSVVSRSIEAVCVDVNTVTVNEVDEPDARDTVEGDTVHVAYCGAPEQAVVTEPLNPEAPVRVRSYVAVVPLATVAVVEPPGPVPNVTGSTPTPARLTV